MPLDIFQIQLTTYILTVELWSRVGPRNIVEPLNAAVLAIIPEKRPNSAALLARRYTCDNSPGKGAAIGENADVARPGCFAAPTRAS
jgi:hypothetical protein